MPIGAAVCCARNSHYQEKGEPVPALSLKQSAMISAAAVLGAGAVALGAHWAGRVFGMRNAAMLQKLPQAKPTTPPANR